MVRACQLDDSLSVYWSSLLNDRKQAEIGLLLGSVGDTSKDFIYGYIPTLGQDNLKAIICEQGEDNARQSKKGGRASSSKSNAQPTVTINIDLIVDHALAVARQLPGGVSVAGLYMLAPDGGLQAAADQLCQVFDSFQAVDKGNNEFYVFHVPSNSKNVSFRLVPAESKVYSDMKPCDIKYGPVTQQLIAFKYSYGVNLGEVPSQKSTTLKDCLVEGIAQEREMMRNLQGVVSGIDVSLEGEGILVDSLPGDVSSLADPYMLELYSPSYLVCDDDDDLFNYELSFEPQHVSGYGKIEGSIHGITYISKRATRNQALNVVKSDLMRSLQTRVDMLIEDAMQAEEEEAGEEPTEEKSLNQILFETDLSQTQSLILPRKVAFPWQNGFKFIDYLLDGETLDYTLIRADESNLGNIESQKIEEWEQVAPHPNDALQWTPFTPQDKPNQNAILGKKSSRMFLDPQILVIIFGIIGGLVAIVLYFVFIA